MREEEDREVEDEEAGVDDGDDVIDDRERREREENRGENCVMEEERKYELKHEPLFRSSQSRPQGCKLYTL